MSEYTEHLRRVLEERMAGDHPERWAVERRAGELIDAGVRPQHTTLQGKALRRLIIRHRQLGGVALAIPKCMERKAFKVTMSIEASPSRNGRGRTRRTP